MSDPEIRDVLLQHFHDVHHDSRSVKKQEIGIRDLNAGMKAAHGLRQEEVARNLDYLVQKGWVLAVVHERTFEAPGGTRQPSQQVKYKISVDGIDRVRGASDMPAAPRYAGVNISNIGGVTVVGNDNIVRTEFAPVAEQLHALREAVNASTMADDQKLVVNTEVDRIELELRRGEPDRGVISRSWEAIKATATVASVADFAQRVGLALAPFLSRVA
jgi:hypothetical protein